MAPLIQLNIEQIHRTDDNFCPTKIIVNLSKEFIGTDHLTRIHPTNIVCLFKITFQMQYSRLTIPLIREKHQWESVNFNGHFFCRRHSISNNLRRLFPIDLVEDFNERRSGFVGPMCHKQLPLSRGIDASAYKVQ